MPQLTTQNMRPSAVLRQQRFFGTYDRAVAWLATEHAEAKRSVDSTGAIHKAPVRRLTADVAVILIADLYGVEPGQVAHDAVHAVKRERFKLITIKQKRTRI